MASFLKKYREAVEHKHGWEADLTCGGCGHRGRPEYSGWTPGARVGFGDRPAIYAKLSCGSCGRSLEQEAGEELVRLFRDVEVPPANRRVLWEFVGLLVGYALGVGVCLLQQHFKVITIPGNIYIIDVG